MYLYDDEEFKNAQLLRINHRIIYAFKVNQAPNEC